MSDRHLQFLLIDSDPIFRLGLKVTLETIPDFHVVADVPTITTAGQILTEIIPNVQPVSLIILELGNGSTPDSIQLGLQFCQELKVSYPHIPMLLLTIICQPELLEKAKNIGINGYCPKGISISHLIPIIQQVAHGGYYWFSPANNTNSSSSSSVSLPFSKLQYDLRKSAINKINQTLETVNNELNIPGITSLDKAILSGQKRELLAARWLINHLLITHHDKPELSLNQSLPANPENNSENIYLPQFSIQNLPSPLTHSIIDSQSLQSQLFNLCLNKLQFPLNNLSNTPLEIDCLQENKKRQLLQIIIHKFFQQLTEIRTFNFDYEQLTQLKQQLLLDLLTTAITNFFTKHKIIISAVKLESFLLEKSINVAKEIVYKIPLVTELIAYIILGKDLYIDNKSYPANSQESQLQAMMILENLIIQVANAVIQPLLNYFADVEIIKQNFYISPMVSTREIEKFRNNLSWKYTKNQYINQPQAIFESRYELFNFTSRGITTISIYAPRNHELAQISGIPLMVTLLLELADAINPRLQSLLSFLGSGIVFILTQVVGKGLGLIGRGIIQGLGNVSLTDKK